MSILGRIAPVAAVCSLGLAIYAAVGRREYIAASICFAIFLASAAVVVLRRRADPFSEPRSGSQTQRSGAHSTNIQAGRDVNIGGSGGKHGR